MENYGRLQGSSKQEDEMNKSSSALGSSSSSSPIMSTTTAAAAAAAPGGATAVPASVCTSTSCSPLPEIKLIDASMSDEKLNQEEHLLTIAINSIGCKNYGMNNDIVHKYPYCDIVGQRYNDPDLKCTFTLQERTPNRQHC